MKRRFWIWMMCFLWLLGGGTVQARMFSDVPQTHPAYDAIQFVVTANMMNGYADGTFRPNQSLTRAQAATILAQAIGLQGTPTVNAPFQDVSPKHGAYGAISQLTERGVFSKGRYFYPNRPVTRGQLAKMVIVAFELDKTSTQTVHFSDVPMDHPSYPYLATLSMMDVDFLQAGKAVRPNAPVKRSEMAIVMQRVKRQQPTQSLTIERQRALETIPLVNADRSRHVLPRVREDIALSKIAQLKAADMAQKQYFDHTSPTYGTVEEMLDRFHYPWQSYGENIATGYRLPENVVEGWISSAGHRAILRDPSYTYIGVGYATDGQGQTYWVHLFSSK